MLVVWKMRTKTQEEQAMIVALAYEAQPMIVMSTYAAQVVTLMFVVYL